MTRKSCSSQSSGRFYSGERTAICSIYTKGSGSFPSIQSGFAFEHYLSLEENVITRANAEHRGDQSAHYAGQRAA